MDDDELSGTPEAEAATRAKREKKPGLPSGASPAEWVGSGDEGIEKKLARAAQSIRSEANGRTCGSCSHIREGWCATQMNVEGNNLSVLYANAVACKQHEERA